MQSGFQCKCGSENVKSEFINGYPGRYGSSEDGYLFSCGCGNEFFVNECAMDYDEDYA